MFTFRPPAFGCIKTKFSKVVAFPHFYNSSHILQEVSSFCRMNFNETGILSIFAANFVPIILRNSQISTNQRHYSNLNGISEQKEKTCIKFANVSCNFLKMSNFHRHQTIYQFRILVSIHFHSSIFIHFPILNLC